MNKLKINTKLIIGELHRAFNYFNRELFKSELPEPAILIQSQGNKKNILGWCTVGKVWKSETTHEERYEINLVAEYLNRGVYPVCATLLHEMVHLYNLENDIKDTSRGSTYHNENFRDTAVNVAKLICEQANPEKYGDSEEQQEAYRKAKNLGWSFTRLTPYLMELIDKLGLNVDAFSMGRIMAEEEKEKKKKKSSSRKYICPECGMTVRATKEVSLICGACSDVENGEVVRLEKELTEEDLLDLVEVNYVCVDCGAISKFKLDDEIEDCPHCGGILVKETEVEEYLKNLNKDLSNEEPVEIEKPVEIEAPVEVEPIEELPVGLTTAPVEFLDIDEDGKKIVKPFDQITIDVEKNLAKQDWSKTENSGWDEDRIKLVMNDVAKWMNELENEYVGIEDLEIDIKKAKSYYGQCKWKKVKTRGRGVDKFVGDKFNFSKDFIENYSDFDIVDVIKHEYVHLWVTIVTQKNQGHNDVFKRYCQKIGHHGQGTFTRNPIK